MARNGACVLGWEFDPPPHLPQVGAGVGVDVSPSGWCVVRLEQRQIVPMQRRAHAEPRSRRPTSNQRAWPQLSRPLIGGVVVGQTRPAALGKVPRRQTVRPRFILAAAPRCSQSAGRKAGMGCPRPANELKLNAFRRVIG